MKGVLLGMGMFLLVGLALGDADALYKQGAAAFKADPAKAFMLFGQAGAEGNVSAMVGAAHCLETGTGTVVDYAGAIAWYEKAVQQNSLKACEGLGRIYASCPDPDFHNGEKAVKYASAIVRKNPRDAEALALLAAAYARNFEFDQAGETQRSAIRFAPSKKLQEMKNQAGRYEQGEPFPAVASEEWIKKAADLSSVWAMFQMSEIKGSGGNPEEALAYCREAMLKGSGKAALMTGDLYWMGRGTPLDKIQAVRCYETAQERGVQLNEERAARLQVYLDIGEKLKNSNAEHCRSVAELAERLVDAAGKKAKKPWTEEEKRGFREKFLTQALYMYAFAEKKGSSAAQADIKRVNAELQKLASK